MVGWPRGLICDCGKHIKNEKKWNGQIQPTYVKETVALILVDRFLYPQHVVLTDFYIFRSKDILSPWNWVDGCVYSFFSCNRGSKICPVRLEGAAFLLCFDSRCNATDDSFHISFRKEMRCEWTCLTVEHPQGVSVCHSQYSFTILTAELCGCQKEKEAG